MEATVKLFRIGLLLQLSLLLTTFVSHSYADDILYVDPLNNGGGTSVNDGERYQCYRCNRHKGVGNSCPETMRQIPDTKVSDRPADVIVRNCSVCMKSRTVYSHRNRDYILDKLSLQPIQHFEEMEVVSRTCVEDRKDARLTDGCVKDYAQGGFVERCYCQGNLCNTSPSHRSAALLLLSAFIMSLTAYVVM